MLGLARKCGIDCDSVQLVSEGEIAGVNLFCSDTSALCFTRSNITVCVFLANEFVRGCPMETIMWMSVPTVNKLLDEG